MECLLQREKILSFVRNGEFEEKTFCNLRAGSNRCNHHSRIVSGSTSVPRRKTRNIQCKKCKKYQTRRLALDQTNVPITIQTCDYTWLFYTDNDATIFDDFSYRVLASWIASEECDGIVEVFDVWRCGLVRSIAEEECEPFSQLYEQEFTQQYSDLLDQLAKIEFHSRRLTREDFFIRPVSFSYIDSTGRHRSGDLKLCLKIPAESCFQLSNQKFCSLSSHYLSLYNTAQLKSFLS